MPTIVWAINNMERKTNDGFVLVAYWTCTATQDGQSYQVYGSQSFPYDPSEPDFVPYDELTEDMVVGWTKAAMGPERVAQQEEAATRQLEGILHPTTASGVPWQ